MTIQRSMAELEAGVDAIRQSPRERGILELIVRRPAVDEREVLEQAELHPDHGLVGDTWNVRRCRLPPDGAPHPDMQINVMNARVIALIAVELERRALAGDQLYVDLDLSRDNLPPGTRLGVGDAIIEVTDQPHRGCNKFAARFGRDALRFVNSEVGAELNLRGINARVVRGGAIRRGEIVSKL